MFSLNIIIFFRLWVHVNWSGCKLVSALCHFYSVLSKEESLSDGNRVNLINPTKQNQMIQKKAYFERGFTYADK